MSAHAHIDVEPLCRPSPLAGVAAAAAAAAVTHSDRGHGSARHSLRRNPTKTHAQADSSSGHERRPNSTLTLAHGQEQSTATRSLPPTPSGSVRSSTRSSATPRAASSSSFTTSLSSASHLTTFKDSVHMRVSVAHRATHSRYQNHLVGANFPIDRRHAASTAKRTIERHTRTFTRRLQTELQAQYAERMVGASERVMQDEVKQLEKYQRLCEKQGTAVYLKQRELDAMKRTASKLRSEIDSIARATITERDRQAREIDEATRVLKSYPSGVRLLTPSPAPGTPSIGSTDGDSSRESGASLSESVSRRERLSIELAEQRAQEDLQHRLHAAATRQKIAQQETQVKQLRATLSHEQDALEKFRVSANESKRSLQREAEKIARKIAKIRRSKITEKTEEELNVLKKRTERLRKESEAPRILLNARQKRLTGTRVEEQRESTRLKETHTELEKQRAMNVRLQCDLNLHVYGASKMRILAIMRAEQLGDAMQRLRDVTQEMDDLLKCEQCKQSASNPKPLREENSEALATEGGKSGAIPDDEVFGSSWIRFADNTLWCGDCAQSLFPDEVTRCTSEKLGSSTRSAVVVCCPNHIVDDFDIRFDILRSQVSIVHRVYDDQKAWIDKKPI